MKPKLLLVLALCAGLGLWAQDANVDPFAAIEAEELCADEMKMVQGGLPRGAGRTTMVIDGVSGAYLNQWQANLHGGYNTGDDYYPASTAKERRKGIKKVIGITRYVLNFWDNLLGGISEELE